MQARYLLDTDICIYVHRRRPAEVLSRFQRLRRGEAAISIVTYGELIYGAQKKWTARARDSANRGVRQFH